MNASDFLSLQDIDTALDVIAHKRPRLPEVIAHREAAAALADLQSQMAAAQKRIDAANASIEAAEHAAADLTRKRTRLEAQLKTVIAPREAEALMHEIEIINGHRGELDDQELDALDEYAQGESTLIELSELEPELESAVAATKAQLGEAHAAVDAEAAELRQRRADVVESLGPESSALYERVRKQFGGVAVARLEGSHCSGCHMDLSPRELDIVKAVPTDTLAECPQCGRIIVR